MGTPTWHRVRGAGLHPRSVAEGPVPSVAVTRSGFDALRARLAADPGSTALLFDFDGTLAPIVDDPGAAAPVDGAADLLERLAARFGRVAVLSGRPRAFLVEHLGPTVDLSGLYGLETRVDGQPGDHVAAERWRTVIDRVVTATTVGDRPGDPDGLDGTDVTLPDGVVVEPKGMSLTVHYRLAPAAAEAVEAWGERVAASTGLELRSAKRSVELHPPVDLDKGTAAEAFAEGCRTVAFFGDDVGDLPAFAVLDRLRALGVDTVKVAVASTDVPESVVETADEVLDGPEAVVSLLAPLVR